MDRRPSPGNTNLESFSNDSVASEDEERILNAEAALLEAGEHRTARPSGFPFLASPRQRASPCGIARIVVSPMVVMVLGLTSLTWLPFLYVHLDGTLLNALHICVLQTLVVLMLVSYAQVVWTDPGTVPEEWAERARVALELHAQHAAPGSAAPMPVCRKSKLPKPPRAHFCSLTRRLVLNMDHFCPWVVNTVGFFNRKYFILFVAYTSASCFYALFASIPALLRVYVRHVATMAMRSNRLRGGAHGVLVAHAEAVVSDASPEGRFVRYAEIALALGAFIDLIFGTMLLFFAAVHIKMAASNETSIESGPRARRFSLGWRRNLESVFGRARGDGLRGRWRWFIPLHFDGPVGDGVHWPTAEGGVLGSLDFGGGDEGWGKSRRRGGGRRELSV